ncbi:DNA-binding GntR family transcriptional regulator [Sphingomonas insulae]|uniref:GntR family transcriptional regulator n=1 Tax=Sphingomonas insulae TaxID=424800 RepID=A0ABP3SUR2_9SPHN|nr:GntR family transcriptional regulator [Sphingomonas insulae]NIJ29084.1 DNA-binding GntR family transcriptional regulator [Sphingomonas insulae]
MSIVVRTLSEQVFEIVRERIVAGLIRPESPIRQDALAAELGVSKIPLREALARLAHDGLIQGHANRGYSVLPLSPHEANEIYALRLAIEPSAAAAGARVADAAARVLATAALAALEDAQASTASEIAVRHRQFHLALVRPADRPLTTDLVERLAMLAERYVIAHLAPAGRYARAHREHRDMLDAWTMGDADTVERAMIRHLASTRSDLQVELGDQRSR